MPIGSISKSGNGFSNAAEYDLAQGKYAEHEASKKPEILEQNFLSSNHYKDIGKEFRELAQDNEKCKKPVMKFSISFDPKENLSDKQKIEFTKNVMKEMGIQEDNHQYMITRHSDKGHDHHHILANRVGLDGKAISDTYSKNRLEMSIDKTEKQMQLNNDLSKTRRFVFDQSQEKGYRVQKENFKNNREKVSTKDKRKGVAEKKEYIQTNVQKSLQESKNIEELKTKLQEKNISVETRFNKENKLTGISFQYDNLSLKGSAMGKEFKASSIEKELQKEKSITMWDKGKADRELYNSLSKEEKIKFMQEKNQKLFGTSAETPTKQEQNSVKKEVQQEPKPLTAFEQAKKIREAKQEQNQEQEKKGGFRR